MFLYMKFNNPFPRKPNGTHLTHKDVGGARVANVELLNVGVLALADTRLVLFEGADRISRLVPLEGSPVPATEVIDKDLVRLDVRLGIGDTVIFKTTSDGETLVDGYDKDPPVPNRVVSAVGGAVWDISDKFELATLETGSIGRMIASDAEPDLTGRPVGINVTFLAVLYSVNTPAVTVIYFVVCR